MSVEAMKEALNALQGSGYYDTTQQREAITALRQAIEQAEKQEPVAYLMDGELFTAAEYQAIAEQGDGAQPLYAVSPKQEIEQAHTDHPARHWDRTCPACVAESSNATKTVAESDACSGLQEPDCGEAGHEEGRCGNFQCITKPTAPPKREIEQKPVAWMYDFLNSDNRDEVIRNWVTQDIADIEREKGFNVRPLYAAPPSKPWVSLTDKEEIELDEKYGDDFNAYIDARDAKLKEKNK